MDDARRTIAVTLLAWYREMGVDAVLADAPVDWLARGGTAPGEALRLQLQAARAPAVPPPPLAVGPRAASHPSPNLGVGRDAGSVDRRGQGHAATIQPRPPSPSIPPSGPAVAAPRAFSSKPPDAAETTARALAGPVRSLAELGSAIEAFDGCGLKATASKTCVYRGAEQARLMIIGEAPGREEDLAGKPFVGRAGLLLDKMLLAIGLTEADVHITNIVYWRPPGNRTPTLQEAQVCRPFLERQVELVGPSVVLLLGGPAAHSILETSEGIMRLRGKWKDVTLGQHKTRALPSLHPAYLLRTPAAKRSAWHDLLAVKAALSGA